MEVISEQKKCEGREKEKTESKEEKGERKWKKEE